ncbi:MAG: homoserine dehydrogenase, partial [Vulcanimicrobiota bacterium]
MHTKKVMKFGGSSLANAQCFETVARLIEENLDSNPVVVVSATGTLDYGIKVTDLLLQLARKAIKEEELQKDLEIIRDKHIHLITELELDNTILNEKFAELETNLENLKQHQNHGFKALDKISRFGEIFSSIILASFLQKIGIDFEAVDPVNFGFVTNDVFGDADILEDSYENIATAIIANKKLIVFPGFIGYTSGGEPTTLGRGGSDYTAAIIGAALKREVEIWTDVNGIYSINPGYLPLQFKEIGHPYPIPRLSYEEAFQMAAFGSRVLSKKTLLAVQQAVLKGKHIRLRIRNTFNPSQPGTLITSERDYSGKPRGITCLEGTQLFNLYPRTYSEGRKFIRELEEIEGITTVLASETYGRLSLVFDKYHPAFSEIESKYQSHISRDQVLIKIVGDGLGQNSRYLSKIHNSLAGAENLEKYGMTVVHKSPQLVTDNSYEFLVKKRGLEDVLLKLYKDTFMEDVVTVGLLGFGTVGSGVVEYSQKMYSPEKSGFQLNFPSALVRNPRKKRRMGFRGKFTRDIKEILGNPLVDVVVELLGGIEPAREYVLEALKQGKHVVTANKALLAEHGSEIFQAADTYRCNIGFEASVCAEIPIIDDFLTFPGSGDIQGIEGIVNGTSNYVLSRFAEGMPMEEAIGLAQQKGFAEADPTMDVEGIDAAQKLSILASILFNQKIDYKKIPTRGITGLETADNQAFERWGMLIKHLVIAKIINDKLILNVGPALIAPTHPLASVREENNALSLYLKGRSEPITKIGKGAGAIPTARSVVRDILDVSRKARAYMVDVPGYFKTKVERKPASEGEIKSSWYLRFTTEDNPGVMGRIATVLGDFQLSIKRVLQEKPDGSRAYVIFELKESKKSDMFSQQDEIQIK